MRKKKLKKYSVSIPWFCSVIVQVEAAHKEEAEEKALREAGPSLCHQCSDNIDMGEWDSEGDVNVYEVKD